MTAEQQAFDPYLKWLGIRDKDQPPHHYRLLGLETFESDADVISNAADARMLHIKTFQSGQYSQLSQRILNEIATAKVCLLNPERKAAYDQTLRSQLETEPGRRRRTPRGWPPGPDDAAPPWYAWRKKQLVIGAGIAVVAAISVALTAVLTSPPQTPETPTPRPVELHGIAIPIETPSLPPTDPPENAEPPGDASAMLSPAEPTETPINGSAPSIEPPSVMLSPETPPTAPEMSANPSAAQSAGMKTAETPLEKPPVPPADSPPATSAPASEPPPGPAATAKPDETAPVGKTPVPSEEEQKRAEKEIHASHESDFLRAKSPEAMLELADSLFQEAEATQGNPSLRYMLVRMSLDQTVHAGQFQRALESAEKLALWYDVDPMEVKTDLLLTLIDARRSEPAMSIPQLETIESGLELIRQAVAEDKYKAAQRMYKPILATARKTKDAMVVQEVTGVGKEIDRLESEFAKLADAKTTLARDPEDPDANLVMGRRYCFDRNLWVQGLVYLSKGSNKTLAELARRDLASPESPEEQTALGDAWWDQAEKEAGQTKIAMQLRAGHWYQQDFGGLSRETTRRRLSEIAPMTPLEQYWQQAVKQPGNVALAVNGAEVRGGGNGLIDGEIPPALTGRGIASGNWPCQWTVVFDKIYAIREIRLMLPEGRNSYENYTLEFSADGKNFFPLADRSGGRWSGPQQFRFLARPMQAIRLTGTFHSLNRQFHASELEAYYVPPRN